MTDDGRESRRSWGELRGPSVAIGFADDRDLVGRRDGAAPDSAVCDAGSGVARPQNVSVRGELHEKWNGGPKEEPIPTSHDAIVLIDHEAVCLPNLASSESMP